MKLFQINTTVNSGSTGRIAEDIGQVFMNNGHDSYIAFGRGDRPSKSKLIKIGYSHDVYQHLLYTRLFDRHAFSSVSATKKLVEQIDKIKPDAIGLHNLHGYYLNIEILFNYLKTTNVPVIWTLFDCWAFTGHCSYFDDINCERWIAGCFDCPKKRNYPTSWIIDNSKKNYLDKKQIFNSLNNLHLIVHSMWLHDLVKKSYLNRYPIHHIPSAVDLTVFRHMGSGLREKYGLQNKKVILGCTNIWSERKGLKDFVLFQNLLDDSYKIVLIGVSDKQQKELPKEILSFSRTESVEQLAMWYSLADVFVNPTYQDNFPTTNIESLACGTPVVTYNTGGSPEAVDEYTGMVVDKGDIKGLADAVKKICADGKSAYSAACRMRAEDYYDKNKRYADYLKLYESLLN